MANQEVGPGRGRGDGIGMAIREVIAAAMRLGVAAALPGVKL